VGRRPRTTVRFSGRTYPKLATRRASVLRCCRSLMLAVGCCCCCHSPLRVRAWPPSPPGCGPWAPPLPPIGLTAADPFAGGEVSRADSRVRKPGTFTCARCPAVRSALDAVPEAYHNLAAVWWGAFAPSPVMSSGAGSWSSPRPGSLRQQHRWRDHQLGRSVARLGGRAAVTADQVDGGRVSVSDRDLLLGTLPCGMYVVRAQGGSSP
jgi:hypothetical protein